MLIKNSILPAYEKLLRKLDSAKICLQNLQREKDYKITKIDNEYATKIDNTMREITSLEIQIQNAVSFVNKNK